MSDSPIVWVRFRWRLAGVPDIATPPPEYRGRLATRADLPAILELVLTAFESDRLWAPVMSAVRARLTERVDSTLGTKDAEYLLLERFQEIAAVSGIAPEHWTDQNLLTGVCVAAGHQRRGLGRYLLHWSLWRLRAMGLTTAQVCTQKGSVADAKLYPLFASTREEGVEYPAAQRAL